METRSATKVGFDVIVSPEILTSHLLTKQPFNMMLYDRSGEEVWVRICMSRPRRGD